LENENKGLKIKENQRKIGEKKAIYLIFGLRHSIKFFIHKINKIGTFTKYLWEIVAGI